MRQLDNYKMVYDFVELTEYPAKLALQNVTKIVEENAIKTLNQSNLLIDFNKMFEEYGFYSLKIDSFDPGKKFKFDFQYKIDQNHYDDLVKFCKQLNVKIPFSLKGKLKKGGLEAVYYPTQNHIKGEQQIISNIRIGVYDTNELQEFHRKFSFSLENFFKYHIKRVECSLRKNYEKMTRPVAIQEASRGFEYYVDGMIYQNTDKTL